MYKISFQQTGQHVYSASSGREQHFTIKRIIINPMYNIQMRYDSDIALVELDRDVKITENVYPICLPDMIRDFEVSGKVIYHIFRGLWQGNISYLSSPLAR